MGFDNIPDELKQFAQFVCWRYEETDGEKPTKIPYDPRTGRLAAVDDPSTWTSFEYCKQTVTSTDWYSGIGFVLTENDPFGFIDLDATGGDTEAQQKQLQIYNDFRSYAERSPSGEGLHIIVKGKLPRGRRRGKIELYSSGRYMTVTGDVYRNAPIVDYQAQFMSLYEQLGAGRSIDMFYAGASTERMTDEEILEIAITAANGEKFNDLFYHGDWSKYYPSQSEADFALFDILAFYSENGPQTQRLFLQSALGQREKSRRQDYANYMLSRCFDRMLPPVDYEALRERIERAIEDKAKQSKPLATESSLKQSGRVEPELVWPPGLVGEIAQFVYAQAPRPVKEIALVAALGIMAGVVGRSYNVSGTGLNLYLVLLANTGCGKEALSTGTNKLFNSISKSVPAGRDFVGPGKIQSSEALINFISKKSNSFCSIFGEFNTFFSQMGDARASPGMAALKAIILQLYSKSGQNMRLDDVIWADKDKNVNGVTSPAFSFIGECTPQKFYECLHEGMVEEGLLPRFVVVEYDGIRVPENKAHIHAAPSFELIERFSSLCAHSLSLNSQNKVIDVTFDDEAEAVFEEYNLRCDKEINSTLNGVKRHLWTRARLSAMKLAAHVAVGINPYSPVIDKNCANWGIDLIDKFNKNIIDKFNTGDVGVIADENMQISKLVSTLKEYVSADYNKISKYLPKNGQGLFEQKIVPYSYIQKRLTSTLAYKNDKMGPTIAIKRAVKTLCERGDLQEVSRQVLAKDFGTNAIAYAISDERMLTS